MSNPPSLPTLKEHGIWVYSVYYVLIRRVVFFIPLTVVIVWFSPYHDFVYQVIEKNPSWLSFFPNVKGVFNYPFHDISRISSSLLVLDLFIFLAFLIVVFMTPACIRGFFKISYVSDKSFLDLLKIFSCSVILFLSGWVWILSFDGRSTWMWGDVFVKNEILFLTFNLTTAWFTFLCYMMIFLVLNIRRFSR